MLKKRASTVCKLPETEESNQSTDEIAEALSNVNQEFCIKPPPINGATKMISTGSTLLDLAITGTRRKGGGVPGGIIMEVFGPHSSGKTALLMEMAASVQARGGDVRFDDPEARLDKEYSEIYGVKLKAKNYYRPDTVREMFKGLWEWQPQPARKNAICMSGEDSLAALSTEMEMEDQDKMGMKRAKDFSEGLRKTCRLIANNNWLVACTNQERDSTDGHSTTPGGKGIPYYASLRIRIVQEYTKGKITKEKTIKGVKHQNVIGIRSMCEVKKSSIDVPYRKARVCIVFGLGIDDVRGNLEWWKEVNGLEKYEAVDQEYSHIDDAIRHIEQRGLENQLKEMVIDAWIELQEALRTDRKKKTRG
jgi:RecA/RadA recombinase